MFPLCDVLYRPIKKRNMIFAYTSQPTCYNINTTYKQTILCSSYLKIVQLELLFQKFNANQKACTVFIYQCLNLTLDGRITPDTCCRDIYASCAQKDFFFQKCVHVVSFGIQYDGRISITQLTTQVMMTCHLVVEYWH